jgi:hypothetical protein
VQEEVKEAPEEEHGSRQRPRERRRAQEEHRARKKEGSGLHPEKSAQFGTIR